MIEVCDICGRVEPLLTGRYTKKRLCELHWKKGNEEMITPIPPDTRTPGKVAYESDADCGEWKEQDKYTKDFWEVAAQAVIAHHMNTMVAELAKEK